MVSQGSPGGVSRCPSTGYIENVFLKYVLLKNKRLHISENVHLLLKYTPLDAASIYVVKMFYFENEIFVWEGGGVIFSPQGAPVSPKQILTLALQSSVASKFMRIRTFTFHAAVVHIMG